MDGIELDPKMTSAICIFLHQDATVGSATNSMLVCTLVLYTSNTFPQKVQQTYRNGKGCVWFSLRKSFWFLRYAWAHSKEWSASSASAGVENPVVIEQ